MKINWIVGLVCSIHGMRTVDLKGKVSVIEFPKPSKDPKQETQENDPGE